MNQIRSASGKALDSIRSEDALTEGLAQGVTTLCGVLLMDQASLLDGLALDAFSVEQNGLAAAKTDVSWGQVAQALVAATGSPLKTGFPVRKGSIITTELPNSSR